MFNKRTNTVKFNGTTQEVNTMKSHDEPTAKKNKGKTRRKNPRVIRPMQTHQRINTIMVLTAWNWENLHTTRKINLNDSQRNVGKAIWYIKKNINNINKHECNVLYSFLNHTKNAESKTSNHPPILQGCMNTCRRREKLKNIKFYWTADSVQRL